MAELLINLFSFSRCCECSALLSHWYYEKDGRLFCRKDYWARFGELCHGCNDPITTGLIMVTGSIHWLSSRITSLVLCWLTHFKLQLCGSIYMQDDKHTVQTFLTTLVGVCRHMKIYVGWGSNLTPVPLVALSDCLKDHQWKLELLCWHLRP